MSSVSLWKISNKSPNVNWFKLRSKVSVANLNLLRFGTFGHLARISFYDTLANYPKLRFCSLGCLGRISFYYTLAIQELRQLYFSTQSNAKAVSVSKSDFNLG